MMSSMAKNQENSYEQHLYSRRVLRPNSSYILMKHHASPCKKAKQTRKEGIPFGDSFLAFDSSWFWFGHHGFFVNESESMVECRFDTYWSMIPFLVTYRFSLPNISIHAHSGSSSPPLVSFSSNLPSVAF